jgi:hypothetical protein
MRYYGFFSTLTKKLQEQLDLEDEVLNEVSVNILVDKLTQTYGYKFRNLCFIRPLYSDRDYVNIYLNTQDLNNISLFPNGLNTIVKNGDIITFGAVGGAA